MTWMVYAQDYTGRVPGVGAKPPEIITTPFASESDARREADRLKSTPGREIIACVEFFDPTAPAQKTRKRK